MIIEFSFSGAECRETEQGVVCGRCPPGYEGDGRSCERRRNMCQDRPCQPGLQCTEADTSPFYRCSACPPGFTSDDGLRCIDVDECATLRPCDPKVRCTNLSPGFKCEACPVGYQGFYTPITSRQPNDDQFQRQRCEDIDECRQGIADCGQNTQCINTEGSYDCVCLIGFAKSNSSFNGCVAIPGLCADGVTVCDRNAMCRPIGGRRYGCKCKVGFAGDGFHCGSDRDLDGFPDVDLKCSHPLCRQDNCPSIPVRLCDDFQSRICWWFLF